MAEFLFSVNYSFKECERLGVHRNTKNESHECNVVKCIELVSLIHSHPNSSLLDDGHGALGVDPDSPRALPQILELFGWFPNSLLKPLLHNRKHRLMQERCVLQNKALFLGLLLAAQAVVHMLHRHQYDLPQALQKHHVQLWEVQLQPFLQEGHHLLGEGHNGVAQVDPAVFSRVLVETADPAASHFVLELGQSFRSHQVHPTPHLLRVTMPRCFYDDVLLALESRPDVFHE